MIILLLIVAGIMLLAVILAYVLPPIDGSNSSSAFREWEMNEWRKRKPLLKVIKDAFRNPTDLKGVSVNGRVIVPSKMKYTFNDIVQLANYRLRFGYIPTYHSVDSTTYTVTYFVPNGRQGSLQHFESIVIEDGMCFTAVQTNKA